MLSKCISSIILLFVSWLSKRLKKPLHHYVSFDKDLPFFSIGLRGFTIRFKQLRLLRRGWNEVFLKAAIPLQIHTVLIENISLYCGVYSPVSVKASGVYFVLNTTNEMYCDSEEDTKNNLLAKRRRLENFHFESETEECSMHSTQKTSWIQRQLTKWGHFILFFFIRRIKLSFNDVHLRLEDELSLVGQPIAAGLAIEAIEASSVKNTSGRTLEISNASTYWNHGTGSELFCHSPETAAVDKLQAVSFHEVLGYQYLIPPTTFSGELQLSKGKASYLNMSLALHSPTVKVQLSKEQMRSVLKLFSFIERQAQLRCFLKFRSSDRPIRKENAREWWVFAFKSVNLYLQEKRGAKLWQRLQLLKAHSANYSEMYEKSLTARSFSKSQQRQLEVLEDEMDLLGVMICRSKVWRSLRLRRLVDDLSNFLSSKRDKKTLRSSKSIVTKKVQTSIFSFSLSCEFGDVQLQLKEAARDNEEHESVVLGLQGGNIKAKILHQPSLSSVELSVDSVGVSGLASCEGEAGPLILQQASATPTFPDHPAAAAAAVPLLSVEFAVFHNPPTTNSPTSKMTNPPKMTNSPTSKISEKSSRDPTSSSSLFHYDLKLSLQQTIFIFDNATALKMADVLNFLIGCSNSELKLAVREQAHDVSYKGQKKMKKVLTKQEMIRANINAHLPLLVLPSGINSATTRSHAGLALKLGHLEVQTSMADKNTGEDAVLYDAKLSEVFFASCSQGGNWSRLLCADTKGEFAKLFHCPAIKLVMTTTAFDGVSPRPRMSIKGGIPGVEIGFSDNTIESGSLAISRHLDTAFQLLEVVTSRDEPDGDWDYSFHRHVSTVDHLTDSRVMEVVERINTHSSPMSKQYMQGRPVNRDLSLMLEVSCNIDKISLELIAEDQTTLNCIGASIEGLKMKLKQDKFCHQAHLEVVNLSLMDSSIDAGGVEVRSLIPIISTQGNKNGKFLSVDFSMADSPDLKMKHQNNVTADIGPIAFFISDASLFCWTKMLGRVYQRVTPISLKKFQSTVSVSRKPPVITNKRAVKLRKQEVSRDVVTLSGSAFLKEVTVTLGSGDMAITKLCLSGIQTEIKDSASCIEFSGSLISLDLLDPLQIEETRSKVISSNPLEKVLILKFSSKKPSPGVQQRMIVPTYSRPSLDPDNINVNFSADVTMGGLSCRFLAKFISTLQSYFTNILQEISKDLSGLKLYENKDAGVSDPSSQPFKYHLSANVHTISLTFPEKTQSGSSNSLQLQLESLLLSKKYSTLEVSGAGGAVYYPVAETMQLDFHSFSACRFDGEKTFKLFSIPDFEVSILRIISGGIPMQALSTEPHLKVTLSTDIFEIYATNCDITSVLRIIQKYIAEALVKSGGDADRSLPKMVATKDFSGDQDEKEVINVRLEADTDLKPDPQTDTHPLESKRELLQLDMSVGKLTWTMSYIKTDKKLPLRRPVSAVIAELVLKQSMIFLDVQPDGTIAGDVQVMDLTLKEDSNILGYIIQQDLYYRKTKPPKAGGGTMDTRRASSKDSMLRVSFSYSKQDIKANVMAQHFHICLWPELISPFVQSESSSDPHNSKTEKRSVVRAKDGPKIELSIQLDHDSVAILNRPSNETSCGVCFEIVSLGRNQLSDMKITFSSSEISFSTNPLHLESSLLRFGEQKPLKVSQVMEPCSLTLLYSSRNQQLESEENIEISASPLMVAVSMETIHTLLKPLHRMMKDRMSTNEEVEIEPPSIGNIWEAKEINRKMILGVEEEGIELSNIKEKCDIPVINKTQKAKINLPDVVINFDVICAGSSHSILSLTSKIEAAASSWSSNIVADATFALSGLVYNSRVAAWEPLIEPLEDPVHGKYRQWEVIVKIREVHDKTNFKPDIRGSVSGSHSPSYLFSPRSASSSSPRRVSASDALEIALSPLLKSPAGGLGGVEEKGEEDEGEIFTFDHGSIAATEGTDCKGGGGTRGSLVVVITSDDRLEITLSPGAIETILKIAEAGNQDEATVEKSLASCVYFNASPVQIRNKTGLEICLYPGPTFKVGDVAFGNCILLSAVDEKSDDALSNPVPDFTVESALAAVTESIPFIKSEPEGKSVVTLQCADLGGSSRSRHLHKSEGAIASEKEQDDWKEYILSGELLLAETSDTKSKHNSLTKLQNYLKQRREAGHHTKEPASPQWKPKVHNHKISIQAKGGMKSGPISLSLPDRVPIPLHYPSFSGVGGGRKVFGVCEIESKGGTRIITIRSALQLKNELPEAVTLYEHVESRTEFLCKVEPNETYSVPVAVFAEKTTLKVGIGDRGLFGEDVLEWSAMVKEMDEVVYLSSPVELLSQRLFHIQAKMSCQSGVTKMGLINKPFYLLTLRPAFVIQNLLPTTAIVKDHSREEQLEVTLAPGETKSLHYVNPTREQKLSIEVPDFKGLKWTGTLTSDPYNNDHHHSRVKLLGHNEKGDQVDRMKIGVYSDRSRPSLYRIYSPYWICNKTGLSLEYEYQSSKLHKHVRVLSNGEEDSISLVYFKPNVDIKDRKLKIRLAQSGQWSKYYPLEGVGHAGSIAVKSKDDRVYEFGIDNSYSLNILTHTISILPKYIVNNLTEVRLRLSGYSGKIKETVKEHVVLDPNEVKTFWSNNHKRSIIHFANESGAWVYPTKAFSLSKIGTVSLVTNHESKLPGLTIRVSPDHTGTFTLVTISPYKEGTAPYRIENVSNQLAIKLRQSGSSEEVIVQPGQSKLYSWDTPLLDWELYWQVIGDQLDKWTLIKDEFQKEKHVTLVQNDFSPGKSEARVYWRVMYDGSQKVFQVFDELHTYKQARMNSHYSSLLPGSPMDESKSNMKVFCSMEGVGLSLLNDRPVEVMYCSVASSPAVWLKTKKGGELMVLEEEQLLQVEAAWRSLQKEIKIDSETFDLDGLKGDRGGTLARSFNPGFWGWLAVSDDHVTVNIKVGRLQIDNQLEEYVLTNRIILAPDKMWDSEMMLAPVVDAGVVLRRPGTKQKITLFESVYLNVKNIQLNVELGLVAALFPIMEPFLSDDDSKAFKYSDNSFLCPIDVIQKHKAAQMESEIHFKNLAISPIKIIVNYSTIVVGPYSLGTVLGNLLEAIVHLGSFVASTGTVNINLDSLKFDSESVGSIQMFQIVHGHYRNEILNQLHSVIWGLDLIGNPSKLIDNLETGVKDLIKESKKGFQKDTVGSGVFGVAVGVKQLLGHVVEGSTRSIGGTAGIFRNTLLETTDLEYKRRHRQLRHETSESLGANLLLGTRFFAEGLIGGLTDIFVKPITGASKSGAKGFFHGVGRGALSILTKPALGVVDLAYFTLEGVRSLADDDTEEQVVRLPRVIHANKVVTPYSLHDAQGLRILWHNPESRGLQYYGHHWLPTEEGKDPRLLLINSLNILKLKKGSKLFKVDDLSIKLEYMQEWDVMETEGAASIYMTYGDDSKLEKLGSFLGIGKLDHTAEVLDKTTSIEVDSFTTAEYLVERITEACEGVLVHYASLSDSTSSE